MNTSESQIFASEGKAPVLWQDKGASLAGRTALPQPASPHINTVAQHGHRLDKVTARVRPEVKDELQRIADKNGISISAAGAAFIERGVLGNIVMQTDTILKPGIEETIRAEMRLFTNRFLGIFARVAYEVGEILVLLTKFLGIYLKQDETTLHRIEAESEVAARVGVTRRTQQVDEVMGKLKQSMEEKG